MNKVAIFSVCMLILIAIGFPISVIYARDGRKSTPNNVIHISAGNGYYVLDTRFNLCFFVSNSTVQISCTPFEEILKDK